MCLSQGSTGRLLLKTDPCAGPDARIRAVIKDGDYLLLSCADLSAGLNYGPGTQHGTHDRTGQAGALHTQLHCRTSRTSRE